LADSERRDQSQRITAPNNETSKLGGSGMNTNVEADPIFSRIEGVRQAFAWQQQLFRSLHSNISFFDRRGCDITMPLEWAETIKNSDRIVNQAIEELLTTAPTTLRGVAAILDYVGSADPDMDETRLFEFADSKCPDRRNEVSKVFGRNHSTVDRKIQQPDRRSLRLHSTQIQATPIPAASSPG
jgi:hypothetical protein